MVSQSHAPFSCFLIGNESLLIRCAEVLLNRGHEIRGIISEDAQISDFARRQNVRLIDARSNYAAVITEQPFDYFFSVANLSIVPDVVVAAPRRAAVNFHDGPLPKYAGLNTPNWSLLNGEEIHGITWHLMDGGVDRGDILKQVRFELAPDETAFTLNMKCYEAAIASFTELVDELASGREGRTPQDFTNRKYFGLDARPKDYAVIDWTQPAEKIGALVRALDFGVYANPIGLPKLLVKEGVSEVYYVNTLEIASSASGARPGAILDVSGDRVTVATATQDVVLSTLLCKEAKVNTAGDVVRRFGLEEGDRFAALDAAASERLEAAVKRAAKSEMAWAERLATLNVLDVPYARRSEGAAADAAFEVLDMPLPAGLETVAAWLGAATRTADVLVSVFAAYMGRLTGQDVFDFGYSHPELRSLTDGLDPFFAPYVPLHVELNTSADARSVLAAAGESVRKTNARGPIFADASLRFPVLRARLEKEGPARFGTVVAVTDGVAAYRLPLGAELAFVAHADGSGCAWVYNPAVYAAESVAAMRDGLRHFVQGLAAGAGAAFGEVSLVTPEEREQLLYAWNWTEQPVPDATMHGLFEAQAERTPDAVAAAFEREEITYAELNARANRLAGYLRKLGVGPDELVGVHIDRSLEMLVALLAVLKAGGAYVPLDPAFPKDRLAMMIEDAGLKVLLTQERHLESLPETEAQVVAVDRTRQLIAQEPAENIESGVRPEHLAYVIYTSGSTGKPKGVMVEHGNAVNFFEGMDDRIGHEPPGTWLAVTSISFDISVLELFWTLARGFKVVIQGSDKRALASDAAYRNAEKGIGFSMFYFASDEGGQSAADKYDLLLEGARFADENGFEAVWTPERHFHAFGGLYPNPSVASAAIAAITKNVRIRSGSLVSPLHNTIRIAEDWAVVDNLSRGRVGISFASGWQPNDFVLMPENFKDRKDIMFRQIEEVQALWRGDSVAFKGPKGDMVQVRTLPRPVQKKLPVWVTAAGNPETFEEAGRKGYNLLTHLLGQSIEELTEKIAIFRKAWKDAGHEGEGHLTLMLHTFVGESKDEVRELVRQPMKEYLRSSLGLIQAAAWSFPTFKQKTTDAEGRFSVKDLTPEDLEGILDFSFERYFETSALFGSPEDCLRMADRLKGIGVNEIACLIDFGVSPELVKQQFPLLADVRARANAGVNGDGAVDQADFSIPAQILRHRVTHLQCTPSQASMLVSDSTAMQALGTLKQWMVGGEALPIPLAERLTSLAGVEITNMYGPTETTIWSTTHRVNGEQGSVPIGRPIANTQIYILDAQLQPVPVGLPGELYIGGLGVTRGYLRREELTAERFVADPFVPGNRMYKTGDLSRYRADGTVEFLGRNDFQVKLRGYRIELGEIETLLGHHEAVREAVVVVREDNQDDKRLTAYVRFESGKTADVAELRAHLGEQLPEYMVPSDFVFLEAFPLTPNGKVDRKALPAPQRARVADERAYVAPQNEIEQTIAEIWRDALKVDTIGANDNFFDLGGHSLLAVQVNEKLRALLNREIPIVDLFRYPTIGTLAKHLGASEAENNAVAEQAMSRGASRREMMLRRQGLRA